MIEEIEQKISDVLRKNKELANQFEEDKQKQERDLDGIFLDVIAVLDAFSREEKVIADHAWNQTEDSQKAIKRLLNPKRKAFKILDKYGVVKITFEDGMSNDNLCIVTDTEPHADKPDGFIISIEKEGYTRNGHLLRRAEVVIVKN